MSFNHITWASLAILSAVPAAAQTPSDPVAEVANIRFYSNELLNLHHTLYASAWAGRTEGGVRVLSQKLPHPLTAPFTPAERAIWDQAVHYYDVQIADREPLSGQGMQGIKVALVSGKLDDFVIDKELRAMLEATLPRHQLLFPG